MTEQELRQLITQHEADRVEFTTSVADTDKFSEAVCAFANDLPGHGEPGYLIIGIDNNGRFSGTQITDQLLQNLGGLRANGNIQPLPSITVQKVVTDEGDAAVVTVHPSPLPPVRYRGRVCIRLGPRRDYATEQEERILIERRVAQARTFDALPCLGSQLQDLNRTLFLIDYREHAIAPEVIAENHRPVAQQLASLRFYDLKKDCPTHAGILLFGLDVRGWLPGAYLQFLRVAGTSLADPVIDDHLLEGDLLSLLRSLDSLTDAQLTKYPVFQTTLRERMFESYPRVAVRELLMNAIMHRDYGSTAPLRFTWFDDRIEIQSPGGLYGEASPANFPLQTSYRNPIVAEALKALGYVNRYGRGVITAQAALERNESPPAEFKFDPGYVLAIIPKKP